MFCLDMRDVITKTNLCSVPETLCVSSYKGGYVTRTYLCNVPETLWCVFL